MGTRNRNFDNLMPRRPSADKKATSEISLGSISATTNPVRTIFRAPFACTIKKVTLIAEAAAAQDNGNYWSFMVANATQTLDLMSAAKVTDSSGGGFTAYEPYELPVDQNVELAANDVLTLEATKTASAPALTNLYVIVEFENRQT